MDPVRICRGLFSSPSIGRLLLPQDLLVFLGPLFLGFILHLDFVFVMVFFLLSFGFLLFVRGHGEGYVRGIAFFFFASRRQFPFMPDPDRQILLKREEMVRAIGAKKGAEPDFYSWNVEK